MKKKAYEIVDSVKQLEKAISRVKEAQRRFSQFSQEQVDRIDRKSTRLNSSHIATSRMPSSA